MDIHELKKILDSDKHETDTYDFKERWENTNSELLKDILSFANTAHHNDCYLIYGINDNKEIVGIDNTDKHRKNQQRISDFLESLDFANVSFPEVNINTLKISGKEVDILTIKDSDRVPFYLRSDYTKQGSSIRHGEILFRDKDSDFGKQKAPTYATVESLWRKHFHLDLTVKKRFWFILDEISNWTWHDGETERFVYDIDPSFCIEIKNLKDPIEHTQFESFSVELPNPNISWYSVLLMYNKEVIENLNGIYLDDDRGFAIYPDSSNINNTSYFYYFVNSLKEKIGKLINRQRKCATDQSTICQYLSSVVLYENVNQKELVERQIENKQNDFSAKDTEVASLKRKLTGKLYNKKCLKNTHLSHIVEERKLTKVIIECKEKIDTPKKE